MKTIYKLFATICISQLMLGCQTTNEEPQAIDEPKVAEGMWVLEYNYEDYGKTFVGDYMEWCNAHRSILALFVPRNIPNDFKYVNARHIIWREILESPTFEELEQKKAAYDAIFVRENVLFPNNLTNCTIYKYQPEYTGPWKLIYYEYFNCHNTNNPDFSEWLLESEKRGFTPSYIEGRRKPDVSSDFHFHGLIDYYENCCSAVIQWEETVEEATEAEVKAMVERFKSFTQIVSPTAYDTFEADYRPINIQELPAQTKPY